MRRMHKPFSRRLTLVALALLLLFSVSSVGAEGEPLDLTKPFSVTVEPCGTDVDFGEDLKLANVIIDLYQIASASAVPGQDTFSLQPLPAYASLSIPSQADENAWRAFSETAGAYLLDRLDTIKPTASLPAGKTFTDLQPGLYVVLAHSEALTDYMRTITDETGKAVGVTIAQSPLYEYHFLPELLTLPTKDPDEDGIISTAVRGEWLYDIAAALKPERVPRLGSLTIEKTLLRYAVNQPGTFVFSVDVVVNDALYSSKVYALTFTAAGSQTIRIDDIPAGATVTVTEVYTGATYKLVSDGTVTVPITAETVSRVSFTNDYTPNDRTGGGIVNRFSFNGEDWEWEQLSGNAD